MNEHDHAKATARERFGQALEDAVHGFGSVQDDLRDLYDRFASDPSDVTRRRSIDTARRIMQDARTVTRQLREAADKLDKATQEKT